MKSMTVQCSGVSYRQGWIEVTPHIHVGYVNLEAWSLVPEVDPHRENIAGVFDSDVTGNVEVELTIAQSTQPISSLRGAIEVAQGVR